VHPAEPDRGAAAGPGAAPGSRDDAPGIATLILPVGDDALLVDLGEPAGIRAARRAQALAAAIRSRRAAGDHALASCGDPIAAATSILVTFDPLAGDPDALARILADLVAAIPADPAPLPGAREHVFPVRYGGAGGPDLAPVAVEAGLTPDDVIALHGSVAYEVLFLGFAPGFGYLGEVPAPLAVPRLATPRVHVAAGSVAIAGAFTAVYPQPSPGGWRLLGVTDVRLFDATAGEPALLRPGDRVRFRPR